MLLGIAPQGVVTFVSETWGSDKYLTERLLPGDLLNTPQPSGKLARWGMAIQELDLSIQHRSGQSNANADALSRCPLPSNEDRSQTIEVVAVLQETTGVGRQGIRHH